MNLVGETNMYEVLAEGYTIRAKHIVVICLNLCMVEWSKHVKRCILESYSYWKEQKDSSIRTQTGLFQ